MRSDESDLGLRTVCSAALESSVMPALAASSRAFARTFSSGALATSDGRRLESVRFHAD